MSTCRPACAGRRRCFDRGPNASCVVWSPQEGRIPGAQGTRHNGAISRGYSPRGAMAFVVHGERPGMGRTLRCHDRKVLGLVLAVLVLAVGFCVFDGDGHEQGHAGLDFCLGMLAVPLTLGLVSRLPLTGRAIADVPVAAVELARLVPAPPPKAFFS